MKKFPIHNIEILKIDTSKLSSLEVPCYHGDGYGGQGVIRWGRLIDPIQDLTSFTKLRKIVAAQEAFFSVDQDFTVCELLTSIEEIGIVDTTNAVQRWLKDMVHNKWKYPNLKTITLWGKEWYDHFDHDIRLGEEGYCPSEDEDSDDEDVEEHQPKENHESEGTDTTLGLTESRDDDNDLNETQAWGSSELDEPLEWRKEFVNASRDRNEWKGLEAVVEAEGKHWTTFYRKDTKWTDP